jgi:hypothetical protein
MHAVSRIHRKRRHVELLQDAERGQRDDPLAIGRISWIV